MSVLWWLVIVDIPNEGQPDLIRRHRREDHLHSRFATEDEALVLKTRLESFGGRHVVVDIATTGGCCPRCEEQLLDI